MTAYYDPIQVLQKQ